MLKFRKPAWLGPIWIGLAQADLDRLILMNTLQVSVGVALCVRCGPKHTDNATERSRKSYDCRKTCWRERDSRVHGELDDRLPVDAFGHADGGDGGQARRLLRHEELEAEGAESYKAEERRSESEGKRPQLGPPPTVCVAEGAPTAVTAVN